MLCRPVSAPGKDDTEPLTNADFEGKWAVYFLYPKDCTFALPRRLLSSTSNSGIKERDTEVVGGFAPTTSISHIAWRQNHPDLKDLQYPLIAAQLLAPELGILKKTEGYCLRATFIVDPHRVIGVGGMSIRAGSAAMWLRCSGCSMPCRAMSSAPCNWQKGDAHVKV